VAANSLAIENSAGDGGRPSDRIRLRPSIETLVLFTTVSLKGRHLHHLVWGILLLLLVGYAWLVSLEPVVRVDVGAGRLTSMLSRVASALTLDEFALWLNFRDVYWEKEGRESIEAIALFTGLLRAGIFGGSLFRGIGKEVTK
jgi:hypothetical protein